MNARTVVATTLIAGLIAGVSMSSVRAFAQESSAPAGAEQKIKRLEGCIDHFKEARKGWSTDPTTEQSYSDKISTARDTIAQLKSGQDVSDKEIDQVCESPHTAPY